MMLYLTAFKPDQYGARLFSMDSGLIWDPDLLSPSVESNMFVQHRPTMLDSTMLDVVGSVWPGLNTESGCKCL